MGIPIFLKCWGIYYRVRSLVPDTPEFVRSLSVH